MSWSPWMILVVVSCFPLSFLLKIPFNTSPSMVHEPWGMDKEEIASEGFSVEINFKKISLVQKKPLLLQSLANSFQLFQLWIIILQFHFC